MTVPRPLHALIALQALTLAVLLPAAVPVVAQPAESASAVRRYEIPAGPLAGALNRFAAAAGIQVSVSAELTANRVSAGLQGEHGVRDGFQALLSGTGLVAIERAPGEYTLRLASTTAPAAPAGATLPAVRVSDQRIHGPSEGTGAYGAASARAAGKLDQTLRETPQSVTVVTRDLLDDSNVQTLTGALRLVPGVVVEDSGPGFSSASVRGFTMSNLQVDGLAHDTISGFDGYLFDTFNTASLDRIEVVRGAAGIVSGNGQPSGSVNLVRKRPTSEAQVILKGQVANYDTYGAEIDAGGPLIEGGRIRARAVARIEDQQDHLQGFYRKRRPMLYGVLEADIAPRTTLSLALDWQRVDGDGLANFRALTGMHADGSRFDVPRRLNLSPAWERADQRRDSTTLTLDHALNDRWSAKLSVARQNARINYRFLEVGVPEPDGDVDGNYATRNDFENRRDLLEGSVSGRFDLFGRTHRMTAGYALSRLRSTSDTHWEGSALGPVNILTFDPGRYAEPDWWRVSTNRYDVRQSAFYASSLWQLAEPLKLQLGARLANHRQRVDVLYEDYDYTGEGGTPYQRPDYDHRRVLTPFAGLVYELTPAMSLYASTARIFQIQDNAVRDEAGHLLDPRRGTNLEVGIKAQPTRRLAVSAAIFQVKQTNVAVQAGEYADAELSRRFGRYYFTGSDGRTTRGIELELVGELARGWQVAGGYTHQRVAEADGARMDWQPRNIVKLASQYRFDGPLQGASLGGSVYWQSDRSTVRWTNGAHFRLPSYAVLNAWAAYRFTPSLQTRLSVTNLADKVYQSNVNVFVNYGEARRVWLSMEYRF